MQLSAGARVRFSYEVKVRHMGRPEKTADPELVVAGTVTTGTP
jgi:hypothetical protein